MFIQQPGFTSLPEITFALANSGQLYNQPQPQQQPPQQHPYQAPPVTTLSNYQDFLQTQNFQNSHNNPAPPPPPPQLQQQPQPVYNLQFNPVTHTCQVEVPPAAAFIQSNNMVHPPPSALPPSSSLHPPTHPSTNQLPISYQNLNQISQNQGLPQQQLSQNLTQPQNNNNNLLSASVSSNSTTKEENSTIIPENPKIEQSNHPHEKTQSNATVLMHTTDDEEAQSLFMASNFLHSNSPSNLSSQFSNFHLHNPYLPSSSKFTFAVSMEDFLKNLKINNDQIYDLYQSVDERVKLTLPQPWPIPSSFGYLSRNLPLNKNSNHLPNDTFRIELKPTLENPDGYINATSVPLVSSLRHITAENANFTQKSGKHSFGISDVQFSKRIIAQSASYSEVASNAFWDMVFETEASLVVSLDGDLPKFGVTGRFHIEPKFQHSENGVSTHVLDVERIGELDENGLNVIQIWFTSMQQSSNLSESNFINQMTYFFNEVQNCKTRINPKRSIIFYCENGVGLSGVFLLSDIVLQELTDATPTMPINLLEPLRVVRPNFLPEAKYLKYVYSLVSGWLSRNERLI